MVTRVDGKTVFLHRHAECRGPLNWVTNPVTDSHTHSRSVLACTRTEGLREQRDSWPGGTLEGWPSRLQNLTSMPLWLFRLAVLHTDPCVSK